MTLLCVLFGLIVAGQAQAGGAMYINSGDWTNTVAATGSYGWVGGTGPGGLPGPNDYVRVNWGGVVGNTVTLTTVAPWIINFQFGVDESGYVIVYAGGVLTTTGSGGAHSYVGYSGTGCIGRMTVNPGGQVTVTNSLFVGYGTHGFVTNSGGNIRVTSHLWVGAQNNVNGLIRIANGGVVNVGGYIGLGTLNASTPSMGTGKVYVQDGGILNLTLIAPTNSIQPNSLLDISGSGQVIVPGDRTAVMSYYTNVGRITAYGGWGTVGIDYNTSNSGKTTLKAVGHVPPTVCTWIATAGAGLWSENTNWSCDFYPAGVTAAQFSYPGAIPCTVNGSAVASYVVMGSNGPGGTLLVTNTGTLMCGADAPSYIGYNSNALMVVENGATVTFGNHLRLGFDPGSDGTLLMNGGTVSVSGMFDLGFQGGKGTAQVKGGTLNLAQFDDYASLQGASVLDVSGSGSVVLNGEHSSAMNYYISTGQLTNSSGTGTLLVDYNIVHVGKTTVYPSGLVLPPEQVVWNPAANPSSTGLWEERANWTGGLCPGNVTAVTFNVPDAIPCTVTNAARARYLAMGTANGPGGTLIITNGASLTTGTDNWTAIGYSSNALMVAESGATLSFGYHLWIGFGPAADGTFILNGATASVAGMFGLGWNGGKGMVRINSGTLNLAQWHDSNSIEGTNVLDLTGTGTLQITGNHITSISNYVRRGNITANGGAGTVAYGYDYGVNKTIVQVAPARQSLTGVAVSGANVTLTYQATPGLFYHIESSPSLSPALWTRVAGSLTNPTGASVTFTFPTSGEQAFYRTVSP